MRGDSLRDLYAKSLALLGLAFLGALGAAVDYWPANLSIPRTSEFDFQIATLGPLSAVTVPDVPVVRTRHIAAAPPPVVVATPAETSATPVVETSAANVSAVTQDTEVKPEALEFAAPGSFNGFSNPNSQIALTAPEDTFIVTTVAQHLPPPPPPVVDKGLIVGFVSSVSDGGSKAGEVFMNSLQVISGRVGGAVKAIWPFSRRDDRNRQMIRPGSGTN